jgi:hypothetical protein
MVGTCSRDWAWCALSINQAHCSLGNTLLQVPTGQTRVHDVVYGTVTFDNSTIDDQILLKADGFPTYHLAVVVDDHLMQITHVLRGEVRRLHACAAFSYGQLYGAHLQI